MMEGDFFFFVCLLNFFCFLPYAFRHFLYPLQALSYRLGFFFLLIQSFSFNHLSLPPLPIKKRKKKKQSAKGSVSDGLREVNK